MKRVLLPIVLVLAPAAAARQYTITPLEPVRPDLSSSATGINAAGVVTGQSAYKRRLGSPP